MTLADTDNPSISLPAARISIAASICTLLCLAILHVVSPEFDPSWRMVSEYALGSYGWILSLMFLFWATSSWSLVFAVRRHIRTKLGKVGLLFLVAAGVGEAMAAVFDVNSSTLHGVSAMIGVPSLPVAAMLISVSLARHPAWSSAKRAVLWTANLTWMSFVLMAAAMAVLFAGLAKTEGKMTPEVIALNGYANRILIVAYCAWVATVAYKAIRLQQPSRSSA